jgi:hypothetical protein
MSHSSFIDLVYRVLPFHAWKDWLLRRHIENCPGCRSRLVSREEARLLLVQADEVGDLGRLWPAIKQRLGGNERHGEKGGLPKSALVRKWRLAAVGLAVLLIAVAVNLLLLQTPRPEISTSAGEINAAEPEQVQIHYVKIENEPAQTFIFQPRDSNILIVWASKNL